MIDGYSKTIRKSPALTATEEIELFKRYHAGETKLEERLVTSHIRVVLSFVNRYEGYGIPKSELIQEGMIGLIRAVRNFEFGHDARLMTYALHCIKTQVHEYVLRNYGIVRIATSDAERKLFFGLRQRKLDVGTITLQEAKRIAEGLNVSIDDVFEMDSRFQCEEIGIDADDEVFQISDNDCLEPENLLTEKQTKSIIISSINSAVDTLNPREQRIIITRLLSDTPLGLKELASEFDVSQSRITQIENNAIKKLKARITKHEKHLKEHV